jgi:hypothetical protein
MPAALRTAPEVTDVSVANDEQTIKSDLWNQVRACLALARWTETMVASGERVASARAAVELVRAYDRVLENIRLVPLSAPEQQGARDRLTPVMELLRKYRLR